MNVIRPHIKVRVIVLMLVFLSLISTVHIWYYYQTDVLVNESLSFFQIPDTVGVKEVSFIDFVLEVASRIFVILT